ncbi:sensor histidine kinase [Rhodoferax aquaticus]|uniref:histidine kinase n=1 Tax=Rhodoferax aquaticus TaxID=2527691 RepID=A0A515EKZ2_9BURK|nr:histidine kinase [Rhodoferax aquaticus]QDL53331.1 sensor histidine kinase [Rhodoferax aquaticus]
MSHSSSYSHDPSPVEPRAGRTKQALLRGFHAYASWLVGLSWLRFFVLSVLVLVLVNLLQELPPFSWRWGADASHTANVSKGVTLSAEPAQSTAGTAPASTDKENVEIVIGDNGVQVQKRAGAANGTQVAIDEAGVRITAPASPAMERLGANALENFEMRTRKGASVGDALLNLAWLLVVASIIVKITYKGRIQAEAAAAAATEVAETESLKRQVTEARLAAMQAQVEPHFLFNTLASIEHLIETDAPRAARMQRSLIQFLREAMPTLREANAQAERDLGRELAVVLPYLEILRMRMDDRLQTEVNVPEGLHSAMFPPMMLQSLVENAIRHGLEPKAEGGLLRISAEVSNGQLRVAVTDTGLGFAAAATPGTGVGLANIRERLQLLYGKQAELRITEPTGGGACVTICVPYQVRQG